MQTFEFNITDQLDQETLEALNESFEKIEAFRKELPFEIYDEDPLEESPIKFKHDENSRKELKKERTTEELVNTIFDASIEYLVADATFHNDFEFEHSGVSFGLRKEENKYFIEDWSTTLSASDFLNIDKAIENHPLDLVEIFLYKVGNETFCNIIRFEEQEDKEIFWQKKDGLEFLFSIFLDATNINTLHKLGKAINRSVVLRNLFLEKEEERRQLFPEE